VDESEKHLLRVLIAFEVLLIIAYGFFNVTQKNSPNQQSINPRPAMILFGWPAFIIGALALSYKKTWNSLASKSYGMVTALYVLFILEFITSCSIVFLTFFGEFR